MRVRQSDYYKLYRNADVIAPAINKTLAGMKKARTEKDEFTYFVLKRFRSWVHKIYTAQKPTLQGEVCQEWLEDPMECVNYVFDAFMDTGIPTEQIRDVVIGRHDTKGIFGPSNIKVYLPASVKYAKPE